MNNHIQISDVTPRIQYAADGSQTEFSYPFPIFVEDDLELYTGNTKEISGYTVVGAGTSFGGSVTFDTPPASGITVTLRRSLAIERTTDFQQSGAFRAKDINDELDYLTAALQQVADDVGRAVRLSSTDEEADLELPSRDERANKVLGFDASGDVIATSGSGGTGGGVTDHGQLTGLLDDDHNQYHNDARGDARYYTQAQIDTALGGKSDTTHSHDAAYAAVSHVGDTSNPHGVTKSQIGLDNVENIKINLSASLDPSQNDDDNDGYSVGSRWINTAVDREFVCVDAAPGAAVWIETTQAGGGGVSDHGGLTGLGDDDHAQYHTNSRADTWLASKTLDDITVGATNKHFSAADQVKLIGIEPGATSDMTGSEIKAAYEAEANTNAFTDAEKAHLAGIEAGAEINDVDTVFGQTGDVDIASLAEETSPASTDWVIVEKSGGGFRKTKTSNLSAGVADHGQLTGLSNDDHSQYHTDARGDARYYTQALLDAGQLDGRYYTETEVDGQFAVLGSAAALDAGTAVNDVVQLENVGGGIPGLPAVDGSRLTGLPSGVSDHGALTGLSDDDHNQYHTDARGDARYYTQALLDAGQLDGRYYTETEVDGQFAALGSAAALDAGTAIGDVVQLQDIGGGIPGLPAVDGSLLTNLSGGGGGEANTIFNSGTGFSLVAPTPKIGTTLQIRGAASPDNSITISHDNPNSNVDLSVNSVPQAAVTAHAAALFASPTFTGTVTMPTGLTGILRADSGVVSVDPGGGGSGVILERGVQEITTTTNNSDSTWVALTNGAITMTAGRTYKLRWLLRCFTSGSGAQGMSLRRVLGGGLAGTLLGWHARGPQSSVSAYDFADTEGTINPFVLPGLRSAPGTTNANSVLIETVFRCTSGGTLNVEILSEINTVQVNVAGDGSYCEFESWAT